MSIGSVAVVVPARNEEARLGACLRSVSVATAALHDRLPTLPVETIVVLDRCTDRSAQIAQAAGAECVVLDAGSVGAARHAGVARAAALSAGPPERLWVATTDADTIVSANWLVDHVQLADLGHDLVVGAVRPDPVELPERSLLAWRSRHRRSDVHIHGANLGFRLSAYAEAGGFPDLREHEDVAFINAVRATGRPWATGSLVTTSARLTGRTPGGFAGYLRTLALELDATGASRGDVDAPFSGERTLAHLVQHLGEEP